MSAQPWGKFYWADWSNDPKLKLCSLAARGLWMQMLCIAAESEPRGYVAVGKTPLGATEIARIAGCDKGEVETLLGELERHDVFSRTARGTIFSRKMVRDAKKSKKCSVSGKKGMESRWGQHVENAIETQQPYNENDNETITLEARSQNTRDNNQDSDLHQDLATPASPAQPVNAPKAKKIKPPVGGEADFDEFWKAYPRKVKRAAAVKAYRKARQIVGHTTIMAGLKNYLLNKPEYSDWAHAASWLNGERWNDDYGSIAGKISAEPALDWRPILDIFCNTGNWQWRALSPEPGSPGCKIPAEILVEYAERLPENPLFPKAVSGPRLAFVAA